MARTRQTKANEPAKLVFPDDFRPDFEGFRPAAFTFLRSLARHNERAWFTERRETYDAELRFPMECLIGEFRPGGAGDGLPVRGDPKKGLFRVHRDVRFSTQQHPGMLGMQSSFPNFSQNECLNMRKFAKSFSYCTSGIQSF